MFLGPFLRGFYHFCLCLRPFLGVPLLLFLDVFRAFFKGLLSFLFMVKAFFRGSYLLFLDVFRAFL